MEGKTYTYKEYKERDILKKDNEYLGNSKNSSSDINMEDDLFKEEYEKYKNYLMIKKECPACHFIQGMIFTGVGFFCLVRMHHFRNTFSRTDFLKMFVIATPSSAFGIYKFSYANYIFGLKNKMDELNKFISQN